MYRVVDVLALNVATNKEIWVRFKKDKELVVKYNTSIPISVLYQPCSWQVREDLLLIDLEREL